jgi:hypothetical protein
LKRERDGGQVGTPLETVRLTKVKRCLTVVFP